MAEVTLEYDARNTAARSIIEIIYKSGLFKVAKENSKLSKEEMKFAQEFKQSLKEADKLVRRQ